MRMRTKSIAGIICLLVAGITAAGPVGAGDGTWTRIRRIAPGAFHHRLRIAEGPYQIHVLKVNLAMQSTIDTVLATDKLPGYERTSSMAGRSRAIAAVNGDYARPSGRPVYAFARDGFLDQTSLLWGRNFAISTTETEAFFGHPNLIAWTEDPATATIRSIDRVNAGPPRFNEVAMFTPSGAIEEQPPESACSVRLYPLESPRIRAGQPGVDAIHTVDAVLCRPRRMKRLGGVVLATPSSGPRAAEITSLVPGQQLTLTWSLGWPEVFDAVGGNPTLVENRRIMWDHVTGSDLFFQRHPRTGVGITGDGRLLLVTVDGRQAGYSVGMTLARFARLMHDLGATWALNLDGGGSTTFVVRGDVKNRPSDGPERAVSSAIVLLPGADPGESQAPPEPPAPVAPGASAAAIWDEVVADPASTGGLSDMLDARGVRLPPALEAAAETFRSR